MEVWFIGEFHWTLYRGYIKGAKDANLWKYYSTNIKVAEFYKFFKEKKLNKIWQGLIETLEYQNEKVWFLPEMIEIVKNETNIENINKIIKKIKESVNKNEEKKTDKEIVNLEKELIKIAKLKKVKGIYFEDWKFILLKY